MGEQEVINVLKLAKKNEITYLQDRMELMQAGLRLNVTYNLSTP